MKMNNALYSVQKLSSLFDKIKFYGPTSMDFGAKANSELRRILVDMQKQSSRAFLRKRCSENMRQIYRGTPMLKCDFNKAAKQHRIFSNLY